MEYETSPELELNGTLKSLLVQLILHVLKLSFSQLSIKKRKRKKETLLIRSQQGFPIQIGFLGQSQ